LLRKGGKPQCKKNSGENNRGRAVLKTNFDLTVATKTRHNLGWWILAALLAIVLFVGVGYFITQACSLSSGQDEGSARDISAQKK
jgi:hypothetical protein